MAGKWGLNPKVSHGKIKREVALDRQTWFNRSLAPSELLPRTPGRRRLKSRRCSVNDGYPESLNCFPLMRIEDKTLMNGGEEL